MTKTSGLDTLLPIINSVQQILSERAAEPRTVVAPPKPPSTGHAVDDSLEIAQRIAERFLAQQGGRIQRGASTEEVSEALVKLLFEESFREINQGSREARLAELQALVRQTSQRVGAALEALGQAVRKLGFGYEPNLVQLRSELGALLKELGPNATTEQAAAALARLAASGQLEPWRAALFALWLKRKRGATLAAPDEEDLELLMTDPEVLATLKAEAPGPWDAYAAQATALLAHRRVGLALVALEEESTKGG